MLSHDALIPHRSATTVCRSYVSTSLIQPSDHDILCLKDKTWTKHKGNQLFRAKILSYAADYEIASKAAKMDLTKKIINEMKKEYQSRFLRLANDSSSDQQNWEIITEKQARDKTSHALRFAIKCLSGGRNNAKVERKSSIADTTKSTKKDKEKQEHERITSDGSTTTESSGRNTPSPLGYISCSDDESDDETTLSKREIYQRQQDILQMLNSQDIDEPTANDSLDIPDRNNSAELSVDFDKLFESEDTILSFVHPPRDLSAVSARFDPGTDLLNDSFLDNSLVCDWDA